MDTGEKGVSNEDERKYCVKKGILHVTPKVVDTFSGKFSKKRENTSAGGEGCL